MASLPPYNTLTAPRDTRTSVVEVSEPLLHGLLRDILENITVDERWYRTRYGDVDEAVRSRIFASARTHYIAVGYFEDRLPRLIQVDEAWYLKTNPDVAEAIEHGDLVCAQDHFELAGFREGRLPKADWSL